MTKIIVDNFRGMIPRTQPEMLGPEYATWAINLRVGDGFLEPYKAPAPVPSATNAAAAAVSSAVPIRSIYRLKDSFGDTWMAWTEEGVSVVRGQIANDKYGRVYFTGAGAPMVTDTLLARPNGAGDSPPYPKQALPLGVPEPPEDMRIDQNVDVKFLVTTVSYTNTDGNVAEFTKISAPGIPIKFNDGDNVIVRNVDNPRGIPSSSGQFQTTADNSVFRILRNDGTFVLESDLGIVSGRSVVLIDEATSGTTYYAYSFKSVYGERGPLRLVPEPMLHTFHGEVTLRIDNTMVIPVHVNQVQIWRTINDGDASDSFYLVGEWNIPNGLPFRASYSQADQDITIAGGDWVLRDDIKDIDLVNAEVAGNALYDPPPANGHSILALTNKVTVMAEGNTLHFSVPGQPHAYPPLWAEAMPEDIVGISHVGTTVIVITTDDAYLAHAADPSNVNVERLYAGNGGVSRHSIVTVPGFGCLYASKVGLHLAGLNGAENLTRKYINADQWEAMLPESLRGAFHRNCYIGFFDERTAPVPGLIFDFQRPDNGLMWVGEKLNALYSDPETNELYGVQNRTVVEWDAGDTNLIGTWTSKHFDLDQDAVFSHIETEGESFNNTRVTLSAGREPSFYVVDSFLVKDDEPESILPKRDDKFIVSITSSDRIRRVKVTETSGEL